MNVIFNDESNSVLNGIYTLADAVVSTLGPRGRNAIIMKDGVVHITKDGVTVANSINSKDPLEQVGISLISQAANKAVSLTGDGTTTSILLASTLIKQGLSYMDDFSNINVYDIKQGMRLYFDNVITQLRSNAKQATTEQDLINIATIAANGNKEIGEVVGKLSFELSTYGVILVESSDKNETEVKTIKGYSFEKGMINNYFTTNTTKNEFDSTDCSILVYDGKINSSNQIAGIVNGCTGGLLIIANDVTDDALASLISYKVQSNRPICVVRAPDFGNARKESLEDIAMLCGTVVIGEERGLNLSSQSSSILGKAKQVIVNRERTVIIEGSGNPAAINMRVEQIKEFIANRTTFSQNQIEEYRARLAKLTSGISVIKVGGKSEVEVRNLKDIYDDVVGACKTAMNSGYVIGSGLALMNIVKNTNIDSIYNIDNPSEGIIIGLKLVEHAICTIRPTILKNADIIKTIDNYNYSVDSDNENNKLLYTDINNPFNKIDYYEAGIIDPVDVIITSLDTAISVAGEFLTTKCIIL